MLRRNRNKRRTAIELLRKRAVRFRRARVRSICREEPHGFGVREIRFFRNAQTIRPGGKPGGAEVECAIGTTHQTHPPGSAAGTEFHKQFRMLTGTVNPDVNIAVHGKRTEIEAAQFHRIRKCARKPRKHSRPRRICGKIPHPRPRQFRCNHSSSSESA